MRIFRAEASSDAAYSPTGPPYSPHNTPDMAKTGSRNSDPVLVDNTPPTLATLKPQIKGGYVLIKAVASDELSDIGQVHYAVNSSEKWQPALPDDLIFDSTKENLTIKLSDLSSGRHVVTLRVSDEQGNTFYKALQVDVANKAAQ